MCLLGSDDGRAEGGGVGRGGIEHECARRLFEGIARVFMFTFITALESHFIFYSVHMLCTSTSTAYAFMNTQKLCVGVCRQKPTVFGTSLRAGIS